MAHFLMVYIQTSEAAVEAAVARVQAALKSVAWEGKLIVRGKQGNPWIQVDGVWPDDVATFARRMTKSGGHAVAVQAETASGYLTYARFKAGKRLFHLEKSEYGGSISIQGKPLEWEQELLGKTAEEGLHDLLPIARQLNLPGFEGASPDYWAIESNYHPN